MDHFARQQKRAVLEKIAAANGPAKYPMLMDDVMKQYERAGLVERHTNGNVICAILTDKGRAALRE